MRAVSIGLAVGGLLLVASAADAQQIKPRVLLMVDTSGSMTEHFTDTTTTGGDGSIWFSDENMTRSSTSSGNSGMYVGFSLPAATCPATSFDGVNSRLYGAKQAVTNVINGSGDIDWGLMRYSGTYCATSQGTKAGTGTACTTGDDNVCPVGQFCINSKCTVDNNLCFNYWTTAGSETAGYGATRKGSTGGSCTNNSNGGAGDAVTYTGSYGTTVAAGNALCTSPQVCYSDADCNGATVGSCVALTGSAAKVCKCGSGGATCDGTNYTCAADNVCRYAKKCQNPGGVILVDASSVNPSPQVLPWVDGIEVLPGGKGPDGSTTVNPELRATNGTPLAGAARSATTWYNSVIASDPKKACRPYVLVQMTDGQDTGESQGGGDSTNGPVAAAASFVAATVPGVASKPLNKVYVVGLAFGSNPTTTLDKIAYAGGTGTARLANSQQDIEAALADIVSSSVLHEVCNGLDDNCNGQCDEDFPGVAVSAGLQTCTASTQCGSGQTCNAAKNCTCSVDSDCVSGFVCASGVCASCSNAHAASSCDNGLLGQCHATGVFVCSADQLSQQCAAPTCTATPGASISAGAGVGKDMRLTNVSGMTAAANLGQIVFVSGSTKVANNGGFIITAVNSATSIDVANSGVVLPDPSSVSWAIPSTQGKATTGLSGGNVTLTLTKGSTNGITVGATIYVLGGVNAANNGQFTVSAVTATTITFANAAGVAGDTVTWAVDICKGVETCNGIDDDCDGIIDNCGNSTPGSCCTSNCPACAVAPFIETCNNCDDDCDGVIDDHLVDTGLACGNNVGDCAGGTTQCCSADPNLGSCPMDHVNDKIWCKSGNPPYPLTNDQCDGTDDNCNGIANDQGPKACFTDGTNTLPPMDDGRGVCHHGIEACLTLPLCGTTPSGPSCITGACPAGWPAGKTCPNPSPSYGVCQGLVAPSPEFCDGLDNDCDGCIDNNPTDKWIGTACCSTGNPADCTNTGTGTRCHLGTWACDQGGNNCGPGVKTCVGSVAKSPEVCNMIDDDCNGSVDDVPGIGAPCTGPGIFTLGTCVAQNQCDYSTNPGTVVCKQVTGPVAETCNGKDDNCNGQIDDNNPPLAQNPLPGVGVACDVPMPPLDHPPCMAGTTVCVAGNIDCQGAVGPMPNQCNGISTDCTGNPNTNGNCPTGFQCYQGNCVAPCDPGEFPCPGGYACNMNTTACDINGNHTGCCVPDACANMTCPLGFNCQLDAQGNATCIDPCANVTCPTSYICKLGTCVDGSCRTQGCPDGQICVNDPSTNTFNCQADQCADVMCDANQFCQAGVCVNSCAGPCPNGQYCDKGQCVPDPCAHTPCVEGQVCQIQNGVGVCVENQCQFGCNIGQACCGGECVADQCENLHCPEDTHCALTPDCQATCETNPASPKDQVVGAGGGGFGCAVAGHGSDASSSALAWLLVVAAAFIFRRRRTAEVRK